jgi:hypothetical protein
LALEATSYLLLFLGTEVTSPRDWICNFGFTPREMMSANNLVVHGGMLTELENPDVPVLKDLTAKLQKLPLLPAIPFDDIVVCGHSLGGGYATIAAGGAVLYVVLLINALSDLP